MFPFIILRKKKVLFSKLSFDSSKDPVRHENQLGLIETSARHHAQVLTKDQLVCQHSATFCFDSN